MPEVAAVAVVVAEAAVAFVEPASVPETAAVLAVLSSSSPPHAAKTTIARPTNAAIPILRTGAAYGSAWSATRMQ